VLYYNTGLEMSPNDLWDAAERCSNLERLFNLREGLSPDDPEKCDNLVHRYFDEPTRRGAPDVVGSRLDRKKFKKMIDEYYEHHGWDEQGVPRPETLQKLGIENEPSHML